MNRTKIQWTDFTSNPIRYRNEHGETVWACVKVSDGCTHCYAETLALSPRMVSGGRGIGAKFNAHEMSKLTPFVDEGELQAILRKKSASGKRCFLGDMTDIAGEWVTDAMLDQVFATMALRPDVTFQLLTKRPERMRTYVGHATTSGRIWAMWMQGGQAARMLDDRSISGVLPWPLPNVWIGTTVEDQAAADTRYDPMRELHNAGWTTFVSGEPLLGSVNWLPWLRFAIDWLILGGESGPHARPTDIAWIRDGVRQCQAARVPVFVKQLGSKPISRENYEEGSAPRDMWLMGAKVTRSEDAWAIRLHDRHGGNPEEWPAELRIRQWPR